MHNQPVSITGLHLIAIADENNVVSKIKVYLEIDEQWHCILEEDGGIISHIVEPDGIRHRIGNSLYA